MTRLNITLPDEIAKRLKRQSNQSRFIADVLKERFELEEKERLSRLLREGYKHASREDQPVRSDWHKTDSEKWE